jgi:hypothetical protein
MIDVKHPYINEITYDEGRYIINLSSDFPIDNFILVPDDSCGYPAVESNLGYIHDSGDIDWIFGHGNDIEEAVINAVIFFVTLIVSPEGLNKNNFSTREL